MRMDSGVCGRDSKCMESLDTLSVSGIAERAASAAFTMKISVCLFNMMLGNGEEYAFS